MPETTIELFLAQNLTKQKNGTLQNFPEAVGSVRRKNHYNVFVDSPSRVGADTLKKKGFSSRWAPQTYKHKPSTHLRRSKEQNIAHAIPSKIEPIETDKNSPNKRKTWNRTTDALENITTKQLQSEANRRKSEFRWGVVGWLIDGVKEHDWDGVVQNAFSKY